MAIDIDEIFAMYEKVLLHGIPDQAPIYDTIEHTFKAPADEAGGVGDPNTGLSLMWMTERKDGSIDPSKLIVSVNESLNPVVVVESDTAIRVKMVRRIREPQARANVEYFTVDGIDDEFPHDHPETMRFFDQASAVRMLRGSLDGVTKEKSAGILTSRPIASESRDAVADPEQRDDLRGARSQPRAADPRPRREGN